MMMYQFCTWGVGQPRTSKLERDDLDGVSPQSLSDFPTLNYFELMLRHAGPFSSLRDFFQNSELIQESHSGNLDLYAKIIRLIEDLIPFFQFVRRSDAQELMLT